MSLRSHNPSRCSTPSVVISDIDEEMEDNQISSRLDERSDPQQDLLQASGKNPSILLELDMDGNVKHLSKAWESVVGTRIVKIVNHPISRIIMGSENDKNVFVDAIGIMMTDDESYRIRFVVATNYALPDDEDNIDLDTANDSGEVNSPNDSIDAVDQESLSSLSTNGQVIELEGQGILIHDKTGIPTHSMWILKPFYPNTLNIELPPKLAESLGFGADIFASYLESLSDLGIIYEGDVPPPPQVLCRICEQQVPSWWLERHSQLCYNEHKCQSEVEMIHDMVIEQKKIIVSITESLNAQSKGIDEGVKDYKGQPLPKVSPPEASKSSTPLTRRPRSGSIMNTLRFPFKTLALLTELCETAIAINPSEFNEEINAFEFSPNTKEAFEIVSAFAIPDSSDLAISLLINDAEKLVKEKADAVDRLKSSLMYSQKIKDEVDELILLTITEAVKNIRNQTFDVRPSIARPMSPNQSQASDSAQSRPLSEKNMSGIVYPKPKPMTVHSNIFTDAYLDTDSLPSPTPGPHYRDGLGENRGRFSPARSITPGTESTSKDVSFDNDATYPGLSDLQIRSPLLTPQRKMSPGIAPGSQNSPMSSIQRNSRSHGFDSGSGTPVASPMIMAHEGPAMEKKGSQSEQFLSVGAMMKPPLSPLLVAMPAPKSIAPSIKDYEIVKPISKGAFGSVYLARRKVTGEYFAIKVLKKSDMIAKNQVTNVKAERAIMMAQSDSPYVAKLYSSFQSKDYLFLVMEYLPGGDCATLVKLLGGLPDEWARQYIAEVIAGVDDLHQKGIVHHDLKPDNLLIDFAGHLKLTDFGLSRMGLVRRQERLNKGSVSEEAFGQSTANLTSHNGRQRQDSISALALSGACDSTASSPTQSFFENIVKGEVRKTSGSSLLSSAPGSAQSSNHGSVSTPGLDSSSVKPMHRSSSHTSFVLPDYEASSSATPGSKSMALFDPENASKYKKFVGTPDYLAPETIRGTGECEASDWWSVGCILFEFLFGYPPFHASTPDKVFENILEGEIDWPKLSPEDEAAVCTTEAKDLITKLLIMDPDERLGATGADEIKDHPYFKNLNWENLWQAEGGFVPNLDDPESTDYFESRGVDMIEFPMDDASDTEDTQQKPSKDVVKKEKASSATTSLGSPSSANSPTMGKHHLSLAIPIHLRERRPSKLSDGSNEFGSFQFRNLPALDKANKDVINRIKAEHMEHRSSISSSSSESSHMKTRNYSASSPSALKRASSPSLVRSLSPSRVGSIPQHIVQTPPAVSSSGDDYLYYEHSGRSTPSTDSGSPSAKLFAKPQTPTSGYGYPYPTGRSSRSNLFHKAMSDFSPSSSDTEDSRTSALERVRKRRQSSKMSDSSSTRFQMLDILLCEPIPIMRYSIKKDLESLGCVVVSVTAGDELIRRATGEVKFDLIITGLRMAKLDVIDIVKLLKHTSSVNSDTPIIAITAYYKEAVLSGYFNDVLEKPVDKRQLKMVLEKHCRWRVSQTEEAVSDSESEAGSGSTSGVDTIRKK